MDITDVLRKSAFRRLKAIEGLKERPQLKHIEKGLFKEPRIKLIRGFRGVGKTTILLQIFNKHKEKSIYFSADNLFIIKESILNVAKSFIEEGIKLLLIDEVHMYPKWRNEIKVLYDEYPDISIVCSGSAPLAFNPERREKLIDLSPLNLSEYLYLKGLSEKVIHAKNTWMDKLKTLTFISQYPEIDEAFSTYKKVGGFPLSLKYSAEEAIRAIYNSIKKSLYEDAVSFKKLSIEKVFGMEKLLLLLATSPPGELSITSLSNTLDLSKTTIYEILGLLENMHITTIIKPYGKGSKLIRGEPKLLFFHPNLRVAVAKALGIEPNIGAIREELAVFALKQRGWNIYTAKGLKRSPDYIIEKGKEKYIIEVGGKGKNKAQFKGINMKKILANDDMLKVLAMEY